MNDYFAARLRRLADDMTDSLPVRDLALVTVDDLGPHVYLVLQQTPTATHEDVPAMSERAEDIAAAVMMAAEGFRRNDPEGHVAQVIRLHWEDRRLARIVRGGK